jgi:hypothetical protein
MRISNNPTTTPNPNQYYRKERQPLRSDPSPKPPSDEYENRSIYIDGDGFRYLKITSSKETRYVKIGHVNDAIYCEPMIP